MIFWFFAASGTCLSNIAFIPNCWSFFDERWVKDEHRAVHQKIDHIIKTEADLVSALSFSGGPIKEKA